jgi:hypothetical protein
VGTTSTTVGTSGPRVDQQEHLTMGGMEANVTRPRTSVGRGCGISATRGAALADKHYSHPLRLNAMYKPPDSTMMSKLDQMNPLVLAKPGYGRFCP